MKKFLSLILAVMMIATMSTTVFAAGSDKIESDGGSTSINVSAVYSDSTTAADVISVDVEWGDMQFTYNVAGTKTWNPATHEYTTNTTNNWTAQGNEIKVTNHSNVDVKATFSFTAETGFDLTGSFSGNGLVLKSGVGKTYAEADSVSSNLTLSGDLAESVSSYEKVGTVTVQISKYSD